MNDELHPSLPVRVLSVAFFSVLTLATLAWFIVGITELISQFLLEAPVVGFNKGSMYMFGCGLGLLLLTVGGVMQGILGLELTPKREALFTRGLVISLLLMFAFPQLTHYLVDKYADRRNYNICSEATYRWLLYSKLYYVEGRVACDELLNEKGRTKR